MTFKFDKKYISSILFMGFFSILILMVIFPLVKKIKENSQQLIEKKEERVSFAEEKKNLHSFKDIYEKVSPDLKKSESLFFTKETPTEFEFINFLEKTAVNCNVSIKISSVAFKQNEGNPLPSLTSNLNVSGSFNDLFKFIEKLENNLYLIEIEDLSIKKTAKSDSSEEKSEAILSLQVFNK